MRHLRSVISLRAFPHACALVVFLARATAAIALNPHPPAATISPDTYRALAWRNIGPFRGGRSVAVAGVVSDRETYYFGGAGGGVFKTTDGGQTWTNITDGFLHTSSVGAIAVAPSNPQVVYVGMGEYTPRAQMFSHGDGIYKSTDAGRTWTHLGLAATREISRIIVDPNNPDRVYVAAQGISTVPTPDRGIYRSNDGGKTWQQVLFVNNTVGPADLAIDPRNPRVLYAAMWDRRRKPWYFRSAGPGSAIYKTVDAGDTWQTIDQGLPPNMGRIGIAVSADSNRLYAIVEDDPKGGLYRSNDAGQSWTLINGSWDLFSRGWYYDRLTADPNNPDALWITNNPLLHSTNGGRTFQRIKVDHEDTHQLWINPTHPQHMILADDGGAEISRNSGKTWSSEGNQPTGQFYRVNTDETYPYHVYGAQQDNTTVDIASATEDPGITDRDWHSVGDGESGFIAFNPKNPNPIDSGAWGGQIVEFDATTGQTGNIMAYPKILFGTPLRQLRYRFNYNAPIVVSQHNPAILYHAAQKLLRSQNRGVTWQEISPDLTNPKPETDGDEGGPYWDEGEIYDTLTYVAESPHDKNVLWTGSDDGVVALTRDGGKSWKKFSLPGMGRALINQIEVSPFEPATAYIATSRYKFNDYHPYLWKTSDFGQTWQRIDNGIPPESWCHVVREDPIRKGLLYAGTETGVFVSWDDGAHWQSLRQNLPNTPVSDLQVHQSDLVISTVGRGFWILDDATPLRQMNAAVLSSPAFLFTPRPAVRTNLGVPVVAVNPTAAPAKLEGVNAPQGAILDYYLAAAAPAKLEILDESGAVVRAYPASGKKSALPAQPGLHRLLWDLRYTTLPTSNGSPMYRMSGRWAKPGLYTVRLTVGARVLTAPLRVQEDPRIHAAAEHFARQDTLLATLEKEIADINDSATQIRQARMRLAQAIHARNPKAAAACSLDAQLAAIENSIVEVVPSTGQRFVVEPPRLMDIATALHTNINTVQPEVTDGDRTVFQEISSQWAADKATLAALLNRTALLTRAAPVASNASASHPPASSSQP